MAGKIIIYGKSGWPYTDKARAALGTSAIYIDVKSNADKLNEMLKMSDGKRQVPVIVEDGKITIGFGGSWGL